MPTAVAAKMIAPPSVEAMASPATSPPGLSASRSHRLQGAAMGFNPEPFLFPHGTPVGGGIAIGDGAAHSGQHSGRDRPGRVFAADPHLRRERQPGHAHARLPRGPEPPPPDARPRA